MRKIDHHVLVTRDLDTARSQYEQLGFQVAPDGIHPFGTKNANLYFKNGVMVETLAVGDEGKYAEAVAVGNTFVCNDAKYRQLVGNSGFSHVVASSVDAETDHVEYQRRGHSGGKLVRFSRAFEHPNGVADAITVKLAFATHPKSRHAFFFTCHSVSSASMGASNLEVHPNGVLSCIQAVSCASEPSVYADFVAGFFETDDVTVSRDGVHCATPNGTVSIVSPKQLNREFGVERNTTELAHVGLVFEARDLSIVRAIMEESQQATWESRDRLLVRTNGPAGPFFAFEQRD